MEANKKLSSITTNWLYVLIMSRKRFQSESTLYICLNVKELLAQNRRDICSLSDCNELSGCGFEPRCSHLNFRYRACFQQGVP